MKSVKLHPMDNLPLTYANQPIVVNPAVCDLPSIDGYEVLQLLGKGGMGQVYQARHRSMQRIVALKLAHVSPHEGVQARFDEEVKAIASLHHPNIAQIFESGRVEGRPFFAMEYVAGGNLSDRLKTGPLPPQEAARLMIKLARAMQHAHEQNVLHRDLKPSNILLEPGSLEPKIADFGLAKRLNEEVQLTRTGDIFGSPSYMAPEQASGVMKLTHSVDVYSLGAVLYECLTGRPPFMGPDAMMTLMLVLSDDPVPPVQLQPKLPADLNTICMKCLEKMPRKRYATALDLADDLERYVQGEPIVARPIGSLERMQKWAMRKPWQAAAAGLAAALLIGLLVGLLLLQRAYDKAQSANDIANQSFQLSKHTLDDILGKISTELSMVPNMERVSLESYRPAVQLFRELHRLRPEDRATTLEYTGKLYEFTVLLGLSHQYQEAAAALKETNQLLDDQLKRFPDDFELLLNRAKALRNQSWLSRRQNQRIQAVPFEKQALTILDSLKKQQPKDVRLIHFSNDLLQTGIEDALAARDIEGVVDRYRQILSNQERMHALEPTMQHAAFLMGARKSLATILLALNQLDEAETLYQLIASSLPSLGMDARTLLGHQSQLCIARGELARKRRSWGVSSDHFQKASTINQQLRKQFPLDTIYLYDEFDIRCKQAELLHDQGQLQEAIRMLKQYLTDADAILRKHPEYTTIAEQQTNYRGLLQRYENELKSSQEK